MNGDRLCEVLVNTAGKLNLTKVSSREEDERFYVAPSPSLQERYEVRVCISFFQSVNLHSSSNFYLDLLFGGVE
jgi:hypothetical protein